LCGNEPNVARLLLNKIPPERVCQFGNCFVGLELWKGLGLDGLYEEILDGEAADVTWSRVAAGSTVKRIWRLYGNEARSIWWALRAINSTWSLYGHDQ